MKRENILHILSFNGSPILGVAIYSSVQRLVFENTDTNILRVCVHVMAIV